TWACRSSSSQDDPDRKPNGICWGACEESTGRRATPYRCDAWRVRLRRAARTPRRDDGTGSVGWRLRGAGARPGRPEVSGVSGVERGEPRGQLRPTTDHVGARPPVRGGREGDGRGRLRLRAQLQLRGRPASADRLCRVRRGQVSAPGRRTVRMKDSMVVLVVLTVAIAGAWASLSFPAPVVAAESQDRSTPRLERVAELYRLYIYWKSHCDE